MIRIYKGGGETAPQELDEQSQQLFVQTIVLAPEVYKKLGGEVIPDDFVVAMKQVQQNPNMINAVAQQFPEVINTCKEMFISSPDEIVAAAQQLQSQLASMKEGGKFTYFSRCYKRGGNIVYEDCGCANIKKDNNGPISSAKNLAIKFSKK